MTIVTEASHFNRILRQTILLPVALILIMGFIVAYLLGELFMVTTSAESSQRTLIQARTCEKEMIDMETGLRGYLLTDSPLFLQPYQEALSRGKVNFKALQNLVQNNPEQSARLREIIQLRESWITDAQHRLDLHNRHITLTLDYYLYAKSFMDGLRGKFDEFTEAENGLLQRHFSQVNRLKGMISLGGLLLLILLAVVVGRFIGTQLTGLASLYRNVLTSEHEKNQELLRYQAELVKQKEWFRVTLSSIGDAVMVTDREGRVVFLNQEAERLSGWSSPEALLQPLQQVFHIVNEATRAPVENPVEKVYREKKVVGLANHTVLIAKDALSECAIEDSAAPIYDDQGGVQGVVLVFHDASEMRQAEHRQKRYAEQLEIQAQERTVKLQRALSEMETFSFTVSHDLRSPLRAMQGYAEAVLEDFGEKLDEAGRRYLIRIKNAAERLDRLIQDLLAYTRISREETPLVPIPLDFLVRDIVTQYLNLHETEADILVEGTLPSVLGRESALVQVFSNLLGNAVKFVPPGRHPEIKIRAEDKGNLVRICVRDNGIGIATNNYERIFKMFEQLNNSALYAGTGVGLAIVKRAVENMQGTVGLESDFGQGSVFWVELLKANA